MYSSIAKQTIIEVVNEPYPLSEWTFHTKQNIVWTFSNVIYDTSLVESDLTFGQDGKWCIPSIPRPKWSVHAVPCSVHCSYTAPHAVYLQYRLLIHFWHTADCSVHCAYTACTLQIHCSDLVKHEWIHCIYTADCSVHCAYTVYTLHIHCSDLVIREWQCTWSLLAAYTAAKLQLYCLYTPLRSGYEPKMQVVQVGLKTKDLFAVHAILQSIIFCCIIIIQGFIDSPLEFWEHKFYAFVTFFPPKFWQNCYHLYKKDQEHEHVKQKLCWWNMIYLFVKKYRSNSLGDFFLACHVVYIEMAGTKWAMSCWIWPIDLWSIFSVNHSNLLEVHVRTDPDLPMLISRQQLDNPTDDQSTTMEYSMWAISGCPLGSDLWQILSNTWTTPLIKILLKHLGGREFWQKKIDLNNLHFLYPLNIGCSPGSFQHEAKSYGYKLWQSNQNNTCFWPLGSRATKTEDLWEQLFTN